MGAGLEEDRRLKSSNVKNKSNNKRSNLETDLNKNYRIQNKSDDINQVQGRVKAVVTEQQMIHK